ncbi:MAG: FAD-binding oxidoreductase [Lewinellaceae bacterium]|nr:FAD-binding oxidoreductase [Lewinellaceae bacterium]
MKASSISQTPFEGKALETLRNNFKGPLILPFDERYDPARALYNGMIDRYPALIAQCADEEDVATAIRYARKHGILTAIRGGGHNGAGLGSCDGGLVIDLRLLKSIQVDHQKRQVKVQAGCTQGEVDAATHPYGLAVPAGIISSTGIAGLALGGGHGYLSRKHGLTIDNLIEAELVLADGRKAKASEQENPDLFWAIRGGGGNFGAVTSFLFRAHPVHTVYAGPMFWPLEQTREILSWYRGFQPGAPEELYGFPSIMKVPPAPPFPETLHRQPVCAIVWCFSGDMERAEEAFREIREKYPPMLDATGPMPFPALQGMFDPLLPAGLQWYWKGDFVQELTDEAIGQHLEFGRRLPSDLSTMHLYPIDGAVHRVGQQETAFGFRDAKWSMVICGIGKDSSEKEAVSRWAKDYWAALHPHSAGAAYVNFMMEEGQERVKATYQANYERLRAVKAKYDPDNFFRVNQNIRPKKGA